MSNEIVPHSAFQPIRSFPETPTHQPFEQLTYVLFKRWRLIFGCLIAFVGAALFVTTSEPPTYSAEAKILLKPDRVSLQISDLSPQSARSPYSAQALQSEIEVMQSRDVLRPVAMALLSETAKPGKQVREAEVESKTRALAKSLRASAIRDASVIQIEYSARSPEEAVRVLDRIVDRYLEHHALAYSGSAQLIDFYEREKTDAASQLAATEEALHRWQEENEVVAVEPRIAGLLQQQSDLERRLKETEAATQVTLQSHPLLARLKGDQVTGEMELSDLLQRYTGQDRRVREKRAHLALLRSQRRTIERSVAASLEAERKSLERQIQDTTAELAALREKKLIGGRLARSVGVAQDAFLLYGKKLEDARISSNLDRAQLSNLAIIEEAHSSNRTDANERMGFVFLAAFVGLVVGLTAAFAFEFFNRTLRTRRDVEVYLGVPVLATIPDLRTAALPDRRRRAIAGYGGHRS